MRADLRVPRFRAATTTLAPVSVPVTGDFRLLAVRAVVRALVAVRRSTYAMLFEAFVPGDRKEPSALLQAAFGFCHGCATYLLIRRLQPAANMEVSQ
ncbi:hypothetical protein AB0I81_57115 [Nonomuraea sp. NPDC050404]|uniref:hypothetical protein n=1 Tax=Nonomuraea sp. NPDC050404 TaxID=3155783 RepID=UPI0033D480B9